MKLTIAGPNLNTMDATFHVHSADCKDLKNYGPFKKMGGDPIRPHDTGEFDNLSDVVVFIYDNGILDEMIADDRYGGRANAIESLKSDFRVFACAKGLPR